MKRNDMAGRTDRRTADLEEMAGAFWAKNMSSELKGI
jgi:hypothetical protein